MTASSSISAYSYELCDVELVSVVSVMTSTKMALTARKDPVGIVWRQREESSASCSVEAYLLQAPNVETRSDSNTLTGFAEM